MAHKTLCKYGMEGLADREITIVLASQQAKHDTGVSTWRSNSPSLQRSNLSLLNHEPSVQNDNPSFLKLVAYFKVENIEL